MVTGIITVIAAIAAVIIAARQLKGGRIDAKAARMADLSWQIYQVYESKEMRDARRALQILSREKPKPATGEMFGKMYLLRTYKGEGHEKLKELQKDIHAYHIRKILRFYHQVGILLHQSMIDADFVFPLIGDGLETAEHGINVSTDWFQWYYRGDSGYKRASKKRPIYDNARKLCEEYKVWKKNKDL